MIVRQHRWLLLAGLALSSSVWTIHTASALPNIQTPQHFESEAPVAAPIEPKDQPSIIDDANEPLSSSTEVVQAIVSSSSTTTSTGMAQRNASRKLRLTLSLMGLSGVTEAICFRRFGCFPNMMTGNTVRCMDALAGKRLAEVSHYSSLVLSYLLGGALYSTLKQITGSQPKETSMNQTPLLVWVGRLALGLLVVSDLFGNGTKLFANSVATVAGMLRMPTLACAFGMINAAANEATGTVTNAITGHYTKIGVGSIEEWFLPGSNKAWSTSVKAASVFLSSLVLTNLLSTWLEATHPVLLSWLPPMGIGLGTMYFGLLHWYSRQSRSY